MNNKHNHAIQQEILYKLNAKAIAFFGLSTVTDIVEDYVINLPQNFHYTVLNDENVNLWTSDVLGILNELDVQSNDNDH
jgi:hypothetical protein